MNAREGTSPDSAVSHRQALLRGQNPPNVNTVYM
jgi:hypothetical protein